jgi:hypothetical protein
MRRAAQALPGSRDDAARMYGEIVRMCDKCCLVLLKDCSVVVWTAMRSKDQGSRCRAREWHFLEFRLAITNL